jgi:acetyltransferase
VIVAVNSNHATLGGETCQLNPAELPSPPDLAVLWTSPRDDRRAGRRPRQVGNTPDDRHERRLDAGQKQAVFDAARPRVLHGLGLNASFAHIDALAGDFAFVSQSGALVTAVLDWPKRAA